MQYDSRRTNPGRQNQITREKTPQILVIFRWAPLSFIKGFLTKTIENSLDFTKITVFASQTHAQLFAKFSRVI